MGTEMQEARLTPAVVDRRVSIVRVHGEACFDCGAEGATQGPAVARTAPGVANAHTSEGAST